MDSEKLVQCLSWCVTFRNPKDIFADHASFLAVEVLLYVCCFLTLKHALRSGGRYVYLWLSTLIFGLAMECASLSLAEVDNFWHAQSMVMFLGQRLPLHVICFYPVIIYTASAAVSRLKLPMWSEMCAVGVATVVLDLPWDVLGIKLLWWTFHDTDPNIAERFYWVPWTSFCFFGAFTSSLTFCLHLFRKLLTGNSKHQASGCLKEMACAVSAALMAIPLGVLHFVPFYHIPHDIFGVSSAACVVIYLTLLCLLAWTGDRSVGTMTKLSKAVGNYRKKTDELFLMVLIYFSFFGVTVLLAQPQNIFSVGYHQPIGDCNETVPVHTPIGLILSRKKYLCPTNYDEGYFDFHCAMQPTKHWKNTKWYIICGTEFVNRNEYIAVIISAAAFGIYFYYQLLINSGTDALATTVGTGTKIKLT